MLLLSELLKGWSYTIVGKELEVQVKGVTECSKNVRSGFIFVARKGKTEDGVSYVAEAIEKGAVAIVVDRTLSSPPPKAIPVIQVADCNVFLSFASAKLAGNPSERLTVLAVTGTNGKTTVTHFIGQILKSLHIKAAVIGTTGVFVDGILIGYDAPEMTTLPAEYFHPLLKKCEEEGVTHIVLEASSLGLSGNRLDHCEIEVGILLNIGVDHYEEHGGQQNYIEAKSKLLQKAKRIAVNVDDPFCVGMSKGVSKPGIYFGRDPLADVLIVKDKNMLSIYGKESGEISVSIPGEFNRMNVLAAISGLLSLGINASEILVHLPKIRLPEGRLQKLEKDGVIIYIDFAHTPDALESVLRALSEICQGKLITVFGCGGNRDKGKRAEMGEIAVFYSSSVIVTSDNPRQEDPLSIVADIIEGFDKGCHAIEVEPDRKKAIRKAILKADAGDIILIAGKGHEKVQHTVEGVFPFSDKEEAEKGLMERRIKRGRKLFFNQFTDA